MLCYTSRRFKNHTDPWGPTSIPAHSVPSIMPTGIPLPQSSSKSSATVIHCKISLASWMTRISWGQEVAAEVVGESLPVCRLPSRLP